MHKALRQMEDLLPTLKNCCHAGRSTLLDWENREVIDENDVVKAADDDIPVLHTTSFQNEDFVFDTQIVAEEVAAAIRHLKCRKHPAQMASSLST